MEKNSVKLLKGIGSMTAEKLEALGIFSIADLLYHLPRGYLDYSKYTPIDKIEDGQTVLVKGTVCCDVQKREKGKLNIYKFEVIDGKDSSFGVARLSVTLFNQKFIAEKIYKGMTLILYGKVSRYGHFLSMDSPEIEFSESTEMGLRPIYPLTDGISQKTMRKAVKSAFDFCDSTAESLPKSITEKYNLCSLWEAFNKIHLPKCEEDILVARRRLAFEEILIFRLGLFTMKQKMKRQKAKKLENFDFEKFASSLSYRLTGAQERVIFEAARDMKKGFPMSRVIQGDVGSGKTVIAASLMYFAFLNKKQSAMIVPTEVLALQHYDDLKPLLEGLGARVGCITGSNTKKEKDKIKKALVEGEIDIIIGTHALIEEDVLFKDLVLAITDEQHRFGVEQRAMLSKKGENGFTPHVLVMSATPIPRSLALIIYGDMDISVIDEMPPGRKKVSTFLLTSDENRRMYSYLSDEVKKGKQAYIVCPMVEEGDNENIKAVESFALELKEKYLSDVKLEFLHGRMKGKEKDDILKRFAKNEFGVLVSTTVIEVGVNVPNATVMIIQNAERFGLSQLHQLRGRVGRGDKKAYCFLISDTKNEETLERMNAFCKTNDGFEISRRDLEIRGPGEIFGSRQHGALDFKIADIASSPKLILEVQECVENLACDSLWFDREENKMLRNRVSDFFGRKRKNNIQI